MHIYISIKEKVMEWVETGYVYGYGNDDTHDEITDKLKHKIKDFVLKGNKSEYAKEFTRAQHGQAITGRENMSYEENSYNDIWCFDIPSLKTKGFVNTRKLEYLTFNDALNGLSNGYLAKLPEWEGYWKLHDDGKIYAHHDDAVELANQFQENIFRTDWILVEESSFQNYCRITQPNMNGGEYTLSDRKGHDVKTVWSIIANIHSIIRKDSLLQYGGPMLRAVYLYNKNLTNPNTKVESLLSGYGFGTL